MKKNTRFRLSVMVDAVVFEALTKIENAIGGAALTKGVRSFAIRQAILNEAARISR